MVKEIVDEIKKDLNLGDDKEDILTRLVDDIIEATHTPDPKNLTTAVAADLIDAIPIIGDVTNFIRIVELIMNDDIQNKDLKLALQTGDFIIGLPPEIGDVADFLTPTNLISYLVDVAEGKKEFNII